MGNWSYRRPGKFYQDQVTQILGLLDKHYKEGQLPLDTYLEICDQKGIEPDPDEMPPEIGDYPYEVQVAFFVHDLLPDRIEGMSGYYMGKDMSPLGTILDIWEVKDRKTIVYFIKHIEARNSGAINKKAERQRKASKTKAKGGGINSADIQR